MNKEQLINVQVQYRIKINKEYPNMFDVVRDLTCIQNIITDAYNLCYINGYEQNKSIKEGISGEIKSLFENMYSTYYGRKYEYVNRINYLIDTYLFEYDNFVEKKEILYRIESYLNNIWDSKMDPLIWGISDILNRYYYNQCIGLRNEQIKQCVQLQDIQKGCIETTVISDVISSLIMLVVQRVFGKKNPQQPIVNINIYNIYPQASYSNCTNTIKQEELIALAEDISKTIDYNQPNEEITCQIIQRLNERGLIQTGPYALNSAKKLIQRDISCVIGSNIDYRI